MVLETTECAKALSSEIFLSIVFAGLIFLKSVMIGSLDIAPPGQPRPLLDFRK
jgi:hypothetical protein